jgi:hypothetical protein
MIIICRENYKNPIITVWDQNAEIHAVIVTTELEMKVFLVVSSTVAPTNNQ